MYWLDYYYDILQVDCPSQWPRGLSRWYAAARLLELWIRIPPGAWMSVSCECCVLSGRGLCVGMITRSRGVLPSVVCLLSVIVKPRQESGTGSLELMDRGVLLVDCSSFQMCYPVVCVRVCVCACVCIYIYIYIYTHTHTRRMGF